jgi:hypothetical protein
MKNIKFKSLVIFLAINIIAIFMISLPCFGKDKSQEEPTAIVVDSDTGQPVEGAVAIAIWKKAGDNCAAFEGGCSVVANVIESVSDSQGRIYIKDFWKWHWSDYDKPWLTVYKFGYVCWSQQIIYLGLNNWKKREDFNKENRIVKLQVRPKEFSFVDHDSFISNSLGSGFPGVERHTENKLFLNEMNKELPLWRKEMDSRNKSK